MAVSSYKTVTRKVQVEICTAEDGTVFEGEDARYRAGQYESKLETLRDLDALFAKDPAVVKAAIIAHFIPEEDEGAAGLWCFLNYLSKQLPKAEAAPAAAPPSALDPSSPQEIASWEAWAKAHRYDMHEHPLHYIFMDPKTAAARAGWRAGLAFARQTISPRPKDPA